MNGDSYRLKLEFTAASFSSHRLGKMTRSQIGVRPQSLRLVNCIRWLSRNKPSAGQPKPVKCCARVGHKIRLLATDWIDIKFYQGLPTHQVIANIGRRHV